MNKKFFDHYKLKYSHFYYYKGGGRGVSLIPFNLLDHAINRIYLTSVRDSPKTKLLDMLGLDRSQEGRLDSNLRIWYRVSPLSSKTTSSVKSL